MKIRTHTYPHLRAKKQKLIFNHTHVFIKRGGRILQSTHYVAVCGLRLHGSFRHQINYLISALTYLRTKSLIHRYIYSLKCICL